MWKCKCGETNPDSSSFCQSCGNSKSSGRDRTEDALKKAAIELDRITRERIQQEFNYKIENLSNMGYEGYYEYKVVSLNDDNAGGINSSTVERNLNMLGLDGWRLRCAYTNEVGRNSTSGGLGGFSAGTNSTIDQNILIFERFVKINKE